MKAPLFTGAATALITPFRDDKPDLESFSRLIEAQYDGGVTALLICGTTGEAATLTAAEKETLIRHAVRQNNGRMKLFAGIGSNNTKEALETARLASDCGVDAVMMVTPYYNKSTQAGLVEHFTYVADRIDRPLVLYNVPSRTGIGIEPETYAILADHPNINGVKEASGSIGAFAKTKALCGDRLNFWSGNDSDTVAMMAFGAKGVVSVASNLVPDVVSRLCALCEAGNYAAAAALNERYMELFSGLFCEVNPIPIKTAMGLLGLCTADMRLPLVPMGAAHKTQLTEILGRCGLAT